MISSFVVFHEIYFFRCAMRCVFVVVFQQFSFLRLFLVTSLKHRIAEASTSLLFAFRLNRKQFVEFRLSSSLIGCFIFHFYFIFLHYFFFFFICTIVHMCMYCQYHRIKIEIYININKVCIQYNIHIE